MATELRSNQSIWEKVIDMLTTFLANMTNMITEREGIDKHDTKMMYQMYMPKCESLTMQWEREMRAAYIAHQSQKL